jgi:hypothetical protein
MPRALRVLVVILASGSAALVPLVLAPATASAVPAAPSLPPNCAVQGTSVVCTFSYNGTNGADGTAQRFTVPAGVAAVTIEAWGAQGGGAGGLGGHAEGTLPVASATVLNVRAGGQGGFNGGGAGVEPGGGASDVRVGGDTLAARVVVAGGGGGEGVVVSPELDLRLELAGGPGGGAAGGGGTCDFSNGTGEVVSFPGCAGGATATQGGPAGASEPSCFGSATVTPAAVGELGRGGDGAVATCEQPFLLTETGAGGGGGYYGGGGGGASVSFFPLAGISGAGGGGSGYVSPQATGGLNEAGVRTGNGAVTVTYARTPSSKDACKGGGWRNVVDGSGVSFRNPGQCVSWAVHDVGA